jgi:hypothetical protein
LLPAARKFFIEGFHLLDQFRERAERHARAATLIANEAERQRAERRRARALFGEQELLETFGVELTARAAGQRREQIFAQAWPALIGTEPADARYGILDLRAARTLCVTLARKLFADGRIPFGQQPLSKLRSGAAFFALGARGRRGRCGNAQEEPSAMPSGTRLR